MSTFTTLNEVLSRLEDIGADIRLTYKGRFMNGTCMGAVVDFTANVEAVIDEMIEEAESDEDDERLDDLQTLVDDKCVDHMGRRVIVYWPGVQEEEEDEV